MPSRAECDSFLRTRNWRLLALECPVASLTILAIPTPAWGRSIAAGAPSFSLFGAFFPGWMFCALIGIGGAIFARSLMVSSGLAKVLPYQLFVCASLGLVVGLLVWLVWFGQ